MGKTKIQIDTKTRKRLKIFIAKKEIRDYDTAIKYLMDKEEKI